MTEITLQISDEQLSAQESERASVGFKGTTEEYVVWQVQNMLDNTLQNQKARSVDARFEELKKLDEAKLEAALAAAEAEAKKP